jgi:hypothetical protein
MTATAKKKQAAKFPKAKISQLIQGVLKDKPFKIHVTDAGIGKMKIVRVVTPAWKSLRPAVRISKVLDAVNTELTPQEQKGILRFSVLTPGEYKTVVKNRPAAFKVLHHGTTAKASKAKRVARKAA